MRALECTDNIRLWESKETKGKFGESSIRKEDNNTSNLAKKNVLIAALDPNIFR